MAASGRSDDVANTSSSAAASGHSSDTAGSNAVIRLPPSVSRILFVKHLPFKINAKEMYEVFGKYGALR